MKDDIKILKGLTVFILFAILSLYANVPLDILGIKASDLSISAVLLYEILIDVTVILIAFLLFKKEITKEWKDFKKNKNEYFKKYFKYWFVIVGANLLLNSIVLGINGGQIANNQDLVNKLLEKSPIIMFINATLVGPILEELVFRFSFRKIFKNDVAFILASGLVFGAFHVLPSLTGMSDLLYLASYSVPGFVFAYVYKKSKNIYNTMFIHAFHNGITLSIAILGLLLK